MAPSRRFEPAAVPVLYGGEISLYTGKLRSYLRRKGIEFRERQATLSVYRGFIVPRTGVRYIPVLQMPDDTVIQDTTEIIDYLEHRHPEPAVYPDTPKQRLAALLLELYGDEWLLLPAMHYRWNFPDSNLRVIHQGFGNLLFPHLPGLLQRLIGARLAKRFRAYLPRLGITPETVPFIEHSFEQLLADLDHHFATHTYLLGERPSIGDFGLIGPFYAHLYRDPYPHRLLRERAPHVVDWVERMMTESRSEPGGWLPQDRISEEVNALLRRMATEQAPVLADTESRLDAWLDRHAGERLPRSIGEHEVVLQSNPEQLNPEQPNSGQPNSGQQTTLRRVVLPYPLWMLQRGRDYYRDLDTAQRAQVDPWLDRIGLGVLLRHPPRYRLERRANRLHAVRLSATGAQD